MEGQRGFTLVELIVAVGITAVLAAFAISLSLALRPAALTVATSGFDASLSVARAVAATSGNGATLVFAPRTSAQGALPGFTLTVYRGRPTAANAVTASTVLPLVADAGVSEKTLGSPPFSIFLSSAGTPSGLAGYPSFGSNGAPSFATISAQPPCPSGGFVLTFTSAHGTQTRTLACASVALGSPAPLATMSPSPIVLTPPSLVFSWPGAPGESAVATEWGYTRWFAAAGFACGAGVAAFPQTSPAPPYTGANDAADASATPLPPSGVPYSFANAPDSMEDAPAAFYVDPIAAGLCSATISDAYGQSAPLGVQVMGALTASPSSLSWTSPAQTQGQNVTFGKTYDSQLLIGTIGANSCSGIATAQWGGTTTPLSPSATPATHALTIVPVTNARGLDAGGTCSVSVFSQYAGDPAATVSVAIAAATPTPSPTASPTQAPLKTWPVSVRYPEQGDALQSALRPSWSIASVLNALFGGAVARADGSLCATGQAQAFTDSAFTQVDANDSQFASLDSGLATDSNGCYNGGLVAYEPNGSTATYQYLSGCGASLIIGNWVPSRSGSRAEVLANGGSTAVNGCTVEFSNGTNATASYGSGLIAVDVVAPSLYATASCHNADPQAGTRLQCNVYDSSTGNQVLTLITTPCYGNSGGYYVEVGVTGDEAPNTGIEEWPVDTGSIYIPGSADLQLDISACSTL